LAQKIAAALPARENVSCEIRNISSLQIEEARSVEQTINAELRDRGVHVSSRETATIHVVVTLSENFENFIWTAETRDGDDTRVIFITVTRLPENRIFSNATTVTLSSEKFWEGREHILDAATMMDADGGQSVLLLIPEGVWATRNGTDVASRFSFPVVEMLPGGTVARNPVGTLSVAGNLVTAVIRQQTCVVSLAPDGLSQCHARTDEEPTIGRVYEALKRAPPAPPHPEWGSDRLAIQSHCGNGTQFLVSGPGDYTQADFLQLYGSDAAGQIPAGKPMSNLLNFPGPVMALHADERGARAVVHNLETGNYEAYRISITCGS
jgi:hypothetical protein